MTSQRYYCYFCSNEIVKLTGKDSDSLCVHHLNGDHNDDREANRVNAHCGCHSHYHTMKWLNDPVIRRRMSNRCKQAWTDPLLRVHLLNGSKQRWDDLEYRTHLQNSLKQAWHDPEHRKRMTQGARRRRLQICKLCGFDLQEDLDVPLTHDQWIQHMHSMAKHIELCHSTEIRKNHLGDCFMSIVKAKQLLAVTQQKPT